MKRKLSQTLKHSNSSQTNTSPSSKREDRPKKPQKMARPFVSHANVPSDLKLFQHSAAARCHSTNSVDLKEPVEDMIFIHNKLKNQTPQIIVIQKIIRMFNARNQFLKFKKNKEKRKNITNEIIATEKAYILHLGELRDFYCAPIRKAPWFDVGVTTFESQLQVIISYSEVLLKNLDERVQNWNDSTTRLGDIFLQYSDFLKSYTQYIKSYQTFKTALTAEKNKCPEFAKLLKKSESKLNNQNINTFLIMPIQRLPRYQLLLDSLLKSTAKCHVDYTDLQSALSKMIEITTYVNRSEAEFENIRKVLLVQEKLIGKVPWLALPHRKFVKEGPTYDEVNGKDRYLYLFNDILIIARPPRDNKSRVMEILNLQDFLFSVSQKEKHTLPTIKIFIKSTSTFFEFSFDCLDSVTDWKDNLHAMQNAVSLSISSMEKISPTEKQPVNKQSYLTRSISSRTTNLKGSLPVLH